jgi:hypothetical protein
MKSIQIVALLTGTVIAVAGVTIVNHTRVDVAESAITCMEEAHERSACRPVAKAAGMRFWDCLSIFAALGWGAGALGYAASQYDVRERERQKLAEKRGG